MMELALSQGKISKKRRSRSTFSVFGTAWPLKSLRLSKSSELTADARKQRYAGLREKCCGTRIRGSAPITPAGGIASCTSTFLTLCS